MKLPAKPALPLNDLISGRVDRTQDGRPWEPFSPFSAPSVEEEGSVKNGSKWLASQDVAFQRDAERTQLPR